MIKMLPNIISLSRIFFAIVFYILIRSQPLISIIPLLFLFFLIEGSDLLDGMLARTLKITSDIGKLLDPMCDITAHFICLFALYTLYMVPPVVIIIFILREMWVIFLRGLLLRRSVVFAARLSGKLKTWAYAIAIFISIIFLPQSFLTDYSNATNFVHYYLPFLYYFAAFLSIFSALHYVIISIGIIKRDKK